MKHAHDGEEESLQEERRTAEPGRRTSDYEQFYREIVETAQEGVWVVNDREETTFANQRLAAMLGYTIEEMIGQPMSMFFVSNAESGEHGERRLLRKDGSSFWAVVDTRRILNREGEYRGMRASVVDVTARRSVEEQLHYRESQLQHAQETVSSLERLAAAAAHEFNNLLTGVQPYADIIGRAANDPKIRTAAAQITDAVARGRKIAQEIGKFTRLPAPTLTVVNVAEWLRATESELLHQAGSRVIVRVETTAELKMIADPRHLRQAFANVANNARDAMPYGGALTISAWRESRARHAPDKPLTFVHFALRDTGTGIPIEHLPLVFEPLFTTRPNNAGLGLTAAQQIVHQHDGEIYIESIVGMGTTVHVLIPAVEAA
ncbi:MAG TPA: ATP-binding protein [Thermoanaerobaculia bacterium]|nr:ATP-binding protein [Thermoanaerobaculia bacterium]